VSRFPWPLQFSVTVPAPPAPTVCPLCTSPLYPGAEIEHDGRGSGRGMSLVAFVHVILAGPEIAAVPGCWPVLSSRADIFWGGFAAIVIAARRQTVLHLMDDYPPSTPFRRSSSRRFWQACSNSLDDRTNTAGKKDGAGLRMI
jgi:hypothetical protein